MKKQILSINQALKIAQDLHNQSKSIVLVGGCFDILHIGHINFLEKAKKKGDYLFVFLESDQKIKKIKGNQRPIFNQEQRAKILSSLKFVDFIILLPFFSKNINYDNLILKLKPDVIALTKNHSSLKYIKKQAKTISAKIAIVNEIIPNISTTHTILKIKNL